MNANNSRVTTFNWKIGNFQEFIKANKGKSTFSNHFELTSLPSIKFALFYDENKASWLDDSFGVILQASGGHEVICMQFKFWIEDHSGNKKLEWTVKEHKFQTVGDRCAFTAKKDTDEWKARRDAYDNKQSLSFCCEIILLTPVKYIQTPNDPHAFRQKLWAIYQEGLEKDITIKVEDREFMIGRAVLTGQCDVFKSMLSSNFKEGITGTIEIKYFDAETIECFIKWLYLGVVEPESLAEKVFLVADKYLIQDLKKQCVNLMAHTLSGENAIERLVLSVKYKSEELKLAILQFISLESSANILKFFASKVWRNFAIEDEESADQIVNGLYAKLQRSDIK